MSAPVAHELDVRGLRCPEPVMLLHARLRKMAPGEQIRVLADDPASARDIPKLCDNLGHRLVGHEEQAGQLVFVVRKRG